MKILIADDEIAARNRLKTMLEDIYPKAEIIFAENGSEAFSLIEEQKPEVAFLDIEMPKLSGIELAYSLGPLRPKIIFVTAYSEYAAKAFELNALDYIIKPFDEQRLKQALEKILKSPPKELPTERIKRNRICFKVFGNNMILNYKDIYFISSTKNYSVVHIKDKELSVRSTLEEIAKQLPQDVFLRVHRSYIVNLDYVVEYKVNPNGQYHLKLKNYEDLSIPVGRQKVSKLEEIFR